MRGAGIRLGLVVALAMLAACGDVPQPFRHEGPTVDLVRPKLTRGVTIRPVLALPEMGDALVKAFERREIPASLGGDPALGPVITADRSPTGLVWTMLEADGSEITAFHQTLAPSVWGGADVSRLRQAADMAAEQLAAKLSDPDAQAKLPPQAAAIVRPKVKVTEVAGLPGDGSSILPQAMRLSLGRAGLDVVEQGQGYDIRGVVAVTPAPSGMDMLSVSWQVVRAADGARLAAIDQSGEVPKGKLSGTWRGLAGDIAEAAIDGILQVVRAAERQAKDNPPPTPPPAPEKPPESANAIQDAGPSQFTETRPADIGKAESAEQTTQAQPAPVRKAAVKKTSAKGSSKKAVKAKKTKPKPKPKKTGKSTGSAKAKKGSSSNP
jgi:hypothetical protein